MRRADRLFEIIQLLRATRGPITAQSIANELEVTPRTIYRDMSALMARHVPITGEAGIGYVLEKGFDMPPLMLASEELDALVLGMHWVATRGEPVLARAAENVLAKVEVVIPEHLREQIGEPVTSIAPLDGNKDEIVDSAMLRSAIREGRKLRLCYRDSQNAATERTVWPILLGYRDAGRILAAWCELRQDFRYFRTERMTAATILETHIPERLAILRRRWREAMDAERERYQAG